MSNRTIRYEMTLEGDIVASTVFYVFIVCVACKDVMQLEMCDLWDITEDILPASSNDVSRLAITKCANCDYDEHEYPYANTWRDDHLFEYGLYMRVSEMQSSDILKKIHDVTDEDIEICIMGNNLDPRLMVLGPLTCVTLGNDIFQGICIISDHSDRIGKELKSFFIHDFST